MLNRYLGPSRPETTHVSEPRGSPDERMPLTSVVGMARRLTRRKHDRMLSDFLRRLNPVMRGWCNFFRHGALKKNLRLARPLRLVAGRRLAEEMLNRIDDLAVAIANPKRHPIPLIPCE